MTMNKGQSVPRNAPAGGAHLPGSPTDLELMAYFDGELEEPRRSAVEAFLSADLGAQNKVAGLRITSGILQSQAEALSDADGIADLVMAKISAEAMAPAREANVLPFPVMATPKTSAPANDNARRIFAALGVLAVAAAAAFALWGRSSAPALDPVRSAPVAAAIPPSTLPTPTAADPEIDAASVNAEADTEHGVEVAAVNFGAHMGSIFYVPSGSIEAKRTTTVVWLADDAGE